MLGYVFKILCGLGLTACFSIQPWESPTWNSAEDDLELIPLPLPPRAGTTGLLLLAPQTDLWKNEGLKVRGVC